MSYKITNKKNLAENIFQMTVEAPRVAKKHKAGQFVILRVNETGERIPLTVMEKDPNKGTITMIVQVVGKTTTLLRDQEVGGEVLDVVGPLGTPTHIENFGNVVCMGGGVGTATLFPIAEALKTAGNKVISVLGAQRSDLLIIEEKMKGISDELYITTDDGSKGRKGFVTDVLKEKIEKKEKVDFVIAVGPIPMMKAVSNLTRPYGIKTMVSLNSLMIDGTGMCGGCRVSAGGQSQFACVDGPEFDAHQVDFDGLTKRLGAYKEYENCALKKYKGG